jgi:hypothetical protein
MLLLLRARDPEGRCIATGIFPGLHETAFYDAGASWRKHQRLYPNELLHWYAMRYWKRRGMRVYNMVGTMDFKRKFGGAEIGAPMIYRSRYRFLTRLRSSALPVAHAILGLAWKMKNLGRAKGGNAEAGVQDQPPD